MEENDKGRSNRRDDIYSKSLRAGNRTYFFDVKSTKSNELYLTITESKRRFNNDNGKFFYEKHKLFLYPEDFESFSEHLQGTLDQIHKMSEKEIVSRDELEAAREEEQAEESKPETENKTEDADKSPSSFSDISFEDLGEDSSKE